jgi:hypothetical protein
LNMALTLPREMPVITLPPVTLRAFRDEDVGLVQSVAAPERARCAAGNRWEPSAATCTCTASCRKTSRPGVAGSVKWGKAPG